MHVFYHYNAYPKSRLSSFCLVNLSSFQICLLDQYDIYNQYSIIHNVIPSPYLENKDSSFRSGSGLFFLDGRNWIRVKPTLVDFTDLDPVLARLFFSSLYILLPL